jgi:phosphatidylserine decarboxylase
VANAIGLIKFGSRVDVLLDPNAKVQIKVGDIVKGGSSVLAYLNAKELAVAGAGHNEQGAH